jgi:hypothetical protein
MCHRLRAQLERTATILGSQIILFQKNEKNSNGELPHQQQLPLLERHELLPFLGYQLLEQCMAYLNLQLAKIIISVGFIY